MPLPEQFNYRQPIEVPDAAEDLQYIRDIAQTALARHHEGINVASLGEGEDEIRIAPDEDGGYSFTAGTIMGDQEAMEVGEGQSISRTLAIDGLLRVKRATLEVGNELQRNELGVFTKRIPQDGLKSFIASIAERMREQQE